MTDELRGSEIFSPGILNGIENWELYEKWLLLKKDVSCKRERKYQKVVLSLNLSETFANFKLLPASCTLISGSFFRQILLFILLLSSWDGRMVLSTGKRAQSMIEPEYIYEIGKAVRITAAVKKQAI